MTMMKKRKMMTTEKEKQKREFYEAQVKIDLDTKWLGLTATRNNPDNKEEIISTPFLMDTLNISLAIDSDGSRKMLLPFSDDEVFKQDKKSSNLHIIKSTYDISNEKKNYVDITLINPDKTSILYNRFNTFCSTVVGKKIFESKSNYVSAKETLQELREFIKSSQESLLSSEEIKGLIGELLVLKRIVLKNPDAFESWHGPDAMRHDFRKNNISIEVKSSSLKDSKKCKINGHDQLEKPDDTELYFVYNRLEQDDKGHSIPSLVKQIEELGISRIDLEKKLNDAGFDFDKSRKYEENTRKYRLIDEFFYIVNDHFPKLTSASFPNGNLPDKVTDIVYQINLDNVTHLDPNDISEMINKFSLDG